MKNHSKYRLVAGVVLSALILGACAHGPAKISAADASQPAAAASASDLTNAAEPSVRGDEMRSIPELRAIYFSYNSADLSSVARQVLRGNAQWLQGHSEAKTQVAGYCDQRGTEEYNLALGQRRADAVRHYYMMLGVSGHQVATISYGKDKLLCESMTESCWRKNRRAQTLVAQPTLSSAAQ